MSVFWTRGYRREGNALQMGLVVVRPGWVAFLPLGEPMGPGEQFALGASRGSILTGGGMTPGTALRMDVPWQARYPVWAWWQHGPQVLDEEVRRALVQPGAVMITAAEGGLVRRKLIPAAFVPTNGSTLVTLDQTPPSDLLAAWPPGVLPLDKKKAVRGSAIVSAVCVALAAIITTILWFSDHEFNPTPIGFFGFIVVIIWLAMGIRIREHNRDLAAQRGAGTAGPYR